MRASMMLAVVGLLVGPAFGSTILVGNNPDVNNGGLVSYSSGQPANWVMAGSGVSGDSSNDRTGTDGADLQVGGVWNQNYSQTYTQEFAVAAGTYDIHVEGWTKVWSGNWGAASAMDATVSLLVDGAVVWTSPAATWDTWVLQSHDAVGQAVTSSIGVRLNASSTGGDGPWSHARFDDIVLSYVPEPVSLVLLGLPMLFLRRRR